MEGADSIGDAARESAVGRQRGADRMPEADDELIALFIESGIGAVPAAQRAGLLRAVATSPALATMVAELAQESAPATDDLAWLGLSRRSWRLAWAACLVFASALTVWLLLSGDGSGRAIVTLADANAQSAHDGSGSGAFSSRTMWGIAAILWSLCIGLTMVALPKRTSAIGATQRRKHHRA